MSKQPNDSLAANISHRRRAIMGALAAGAGIGALGKTTAKGDDGHEDYKEEYEKEKHERDTIGPIFGYPAESLDVEPPVEPDYEVTLEERPPDGENAFDAFPEWFFEPTGLYIEPGDTVQFTLASHFHTITAYHPQMGYERRVPENVGPISSPVLWEGSYFLYTFEKSGVYDLLCLPHEWAGMVIRVVVGEATGPGAEPVPEPTYSEQFPDPDSPLPPDWLGAKVLRDPALDPENIIETGRVSWDDLDPESKQLPEEFLTPPVAGETLMAILSAAEASTESLGRGCAHFQETNGTLMFDLIAENLVGEVTQAHIHEGEQTEEGPIVATLFEFTEESDGSGQGQPQSVEPGSPLIESGTVTDPDLIEEILANPTGYYVNVHTTTFPGGEIRGQLRGRAMVDETE